MCLARAANVDCVLHFAEHCAAKRMVMVLRMMNIGPHRDPCDMVIRVRKHVQLDNRARGNVHTDTDTHTHSDGGHADIATGAYQFMQHLCFHRIKTHSQTSTSQVH